jgi:hypothetical protein
MGIETGFVLSPYSCSLPAPLTQISFHLIALLQVITEDGIHICQIERGVLVHNLFGCGSFLESSYDGV